VIAAACVPPSAKLEQTVPGVICGCIDIGTNTTRLLVAEVSGGGFDPVEAERVFTRVGAAIEADGAIAQSKIAEVAAVAGRQVDAARGAGAERIAVVATAAVRAAPNVGEVADAVASATGIELAVLTGEQEARLSFEGATCGLSPEADPVAVVDIGGGSTEVVVGHAGGGADWWISLPVGSGVLTDQCVRSDPPAATEIDELRGWVRDALEPVAPPPAGAALAVGGTAMSLAALVGTEITGETLDRALEVLAGMPCAEASEHFGIDPVRVRLLPAGIAILAGVSGHLGLDPTIAGGGLREGVVLALEGGEL
jgi:exopolyphosphatase/guanosine-5'-triphosphate,3'-diphosphate pyrophosphatase